MQSRGRAYNIRQQQRKKAEQAKRAKENGWNTSAKSVGIMTNTPTPCSAECCGNPRKHHGNSKHAKTQQELIAERIDRDTYSDRVCGKHSSEYPEHDDQTM